MGTRVRIILYARDETKATTASRAALARIARLDLVCSDYRNDSELTRFVESAGQGMVEIDPDLYQIFLVSQQWATDTGGLFDVTMAPVIQLWRRARRIRELPDPARLATARSLVGIEKLRLTPASSTYARSGKQASRKGTTRTEVPLAALDRPGMRIDLGGIAKGYAAQAAVSEMVRLGVNRTIVAIGGDIVAGEPPPGEAGWRVAVAPLDATAQPSTYLYLRNSAVSTSGDANQSVTIDGVRYSHIVDPRTGRGVIGHHSVTVVSGDGAASDVLATTLSILGPADGLALLARLSSRMPGLAACFDEPAGKTHSPAWTGHLAPPENRTRH